ncbi:hypothetical protein GJ688_15030 [Heliobacillus mobilis]|uniref:Uncharacterized protein n=1 Tax=Heliobacterium mobile TaxID=28064 RepID=A0A6I3SP35_HELMO|nr:hypothetical protein [Heliobacterium mobile]MTV50282.1 hypothetical protein [Heliobacterium mobile]
MPSFQNRQELVNELEYHYFIFLLFSIFGIVEAIQLYHQKQRKELTIYLFLLLPGLVITVYTATQVGLPSIAEELGSWFGWMSQ